MNDSSEQLAEIFCALSKAQGEKNNDLESDICSDISRKFHGPFNTNGRSGKNIFEKFMEKVCFGSSDCWFWYGFRDKNKYGKLKKTQKNLCFAHRISWELFKGKIPDDKKVLHKCDTPSCVNPDHLFIGTQQDNVNDMVKKGRNISVPMFGEKNPMTKLKSLEILEIRKLFEIRNLTVLQIANKFCISTANVYRIANKKTWRNI